ncbi:MAG: hypothetical protein L6W00_06790 [Lentisphaeria bacterium]|nr:MAG: hypothetical protein L6W00_06790 [Lentisphaeria bacterium]
MPGIRIQMLPRVRIAMPAITPAPPEPETFPLHRPEHEVEKQREVERLQRLILMERGIEQKGRGNRGENRRGISGPSPEDPGGGESGEPAATAPSRDCTAITNQTEAPETR